MGTIMLTLSRWCLQSSTDFARMLQALDDQCFDAAQKEYEQLQRPLDAINAC
jgi:hypothetical protein